MVVNKLKLQNIRSHTEYNILFSPDITVITGSNGSGKTSIIEALCVALRGNSFKGSDKDILKHNSSWWRIDLEFDNKDTRIITFDPNLNTLKKKINIDNKINYRLLPKYKYPIVLFEPEDLRLLNGSPNRRRKFIDDFITQLDPLYHNSVIKYERALKQRNNLLKKAFINKDELFAWELILSEHGAYIIEKRIAFIEYINSKLNDEYKLITKTNDLISVHYSNTYIGDIKQKILNDLHINQEKDKLLGYTSVGPHRHDVIFVFNNSPALDVASRGEVRGIVIALKFLEVDIIEQLLNVKPLILLDDVFSELDENRQKYLIDSQKGQIIITSAHIPEVIKKYNIINLDIK